MMSLFTKFVIFFIWVAAIFDPIGNVFAIRYIAMGLFVSNIALIPMFIKIKELDIIWRGFFILVLSIIMPIYGLIIYLFNTRGGDFIDTSYLAAGFLILYSLLYYENSLAKFSLFCMIWVLRILVVVIFLSALFQTQNNFEALSFWTERNVAIIGFREYGTIQFPYIYFLSSPLLIFLLVHDYDKINKKFSLVNVFLFISTSFALILSGTRAHIIMPFFIIPLYYFLSLTFQKRLLYLPVFFLAFLFIFLNNEVSILSKDFFSTKESSNQIKISLLSGYAEIFSDPFTFIFGQGYNAHEWSYTLRRMIVMEDKASKTELTYIEIWRVYGVFFFVIFVGMLAFVLKKLNGISFRYYWLYLSFFLFLLNASINPYLFSSNGMLPLGVILAVIFFESKKNVLSHN